MTPGTHGSAATWVVVFVLALAVQRVAELILSSRHERALRALGAHEHGRGHFPLVVAVHVLFPLGLLVEVLALGARPGPLWPLWLGLVLAAQALRIAAMRALGVRWSVHVWVVPGLPLVREGPYRFMRHPNYVAVVTELFAGPMMFGAWRTALVVSALDVVALAIRIRTEERALRDAEAAPPSAPLGERTA